MNAASLATGDQVDGKTVASITRFSTTYHGPMIGLTFTDGSFRNLSPRTIVTGA